VLIAFDFFGTLVDYEVSSPLDNFHAPVQVLTQAGFSVDVTELYAVWQRVYADMAGESLLTLDEFSFESACQHAIEVACGSLATEAVQTKFMHSMLAGWNAKVSLVPGVAQMLEELRRNHTLAVISNTHYAPLVHGNLARFGIDGYFSQVLTSVAHGKRKPSPHIFHTMLGQLGFTAAQSVFVGDNPIDDYAGAKAAGMRALLIDPLGRHAQVPDEARIAHVLDVPHRIKF